jgi:hypothetical protein
MATGLTRLRLVAVYLTPTEAQQESMLGTAQLLQLLARLPVLQHLELNAITGDWPQQLSLYSALTASSSLQVLSLHTCKTPVGAWAHVFPDGRQLPCLHTFVVLGMNDETDPDGDEEQQTYALGSDDISRLVSCAPALKQLHSTTRAGVSLAPLKSLTALTGLQIKLQRDAGVPCVSPAVIRSELAASTQLQDLRVPVLSGGQTIDLQGRPVPPGPDLFLPLTALQHLTRLAVAEVTESLEFDGAEFDSVATLVRSLRMVRLASKVSTNTLGWVCMSCEKHAVTVGWHSSSIVGGLVAGLRSVAGRVSAGEHAVKRTFLLQPCSLQSAPAQQV